MKKYPLVSIILVNHNDAKFLEDCLSSLFKTNYPNFEIIIVDNASTDNSLEIIRKMIKGKKNVKLILSDKNLGFSKGNNLGAKHANGSFLMFLNVDTKVDKNWLRELVKELKENKKWGMVQSKLLRFDNPKVLDSFGCFIDYLGYSYEERGWEARHFKKKRETFYLTGAAILIRRDVYEEIVRKTGEFFNSDFFIYGEDTELGWKVRLLGYGVGVIPTSLVFHKRTTLSFKKASPSRMFQLTKNKIYGLIELYSLKNILKYVPFTILFEIGRSILIFPLHPTHSIATLKAIVWNFINIDKILKKRKIVQKMRKVDDIKIMRWMKKPSLSYLFMSYKEKYFS